MSGIQQCPTARSKGNLGIVSAGLHYDILSCTMKCVAVVLFAFATALAQQNATKPPLYNTAKQKLLDGKQVFSYTQSKFDIAGHCEAAKHYDYTWFEMQHSTLE